MLYKRFTVKNFRGIQEVSISLARNDLVLLLGLNESGKTTILRAIEAFDFLTDPVDKKALDAFHKSIRNKTEVEFSGDALITAEIELESALSVKDFSSLTKGLDEPVKQLFEAFLNEINKLGTVIVSRVFPFKKGNPGNPYYRFETDHPFVKQGISTTLAKELVKMSPFIIYFEDFKDRIPERIYVNKANPEYNSDWYDIIDGLFYNTDPQFSIASFRRYYAPNNRREDDARTVLKKVNKTLNNVFTEKWKALSGVKDIESTDLNYLPDKKCFEIKVADGDGTTFSVDERSKGALWYLSFLMKTEFRRKMLRANSGRPVFLIDEPASNLHSSAQSNMVGDFVKLVEDTSVIYTTHSQYLISLHNIRNTYVVKRGGGKVTCLPWGEFLKGADSDVTYYQPLADILNIVPNNFAIPWQKALITEGPSDMHVFQLMWRVLERGLCEFVIYPGTSANKLSTIITLNLGWQANFKVMLDSDEAGVEARQVYIDDFNLDENTVQVLPIPNKKIETYFTQEEKKKLYALAMGEEKTDSVTKKEFASVMSLLNQDHGNEKKIDALLTDETKKNFQTIFDTLAL